ncbi:MAG: alpha/beta hydrolase family protein [Flammeovirgaceae bacterium]
MKQIDQILKSKHNDRAFTLDVRWKISEYHKPAILFVHGFKGFKDWGPFNVMANYFAQAGFVFAKMNLSHNGTTVEHPLDFADLEAFGHNNFSIELDDVEVAIDYLTTAAQKIPIDASSIYLIGHSRGGGLVLLKAREDRRVKKVCTWAAVSDYVDFLSKNTDVEKWKTEGVKYIWNGRTKQDMPLYYQIFEDLQANLERFDILKAASELQQPLLVVHGMDDETVRLKSAQQIHAQKADSQLFLVPEGTHTFGGYHPYDKTELVEPLKAVVDKTISFFK